LLRTVGHTSTRLASLDETRVDEHYAMVRAQFVWCFEKATAPPIDVRGFLAGTANARPVGVIRRAGRSRTSGVGVVSHGWLIERWRCSLHDRGSPWCCRCSCSV
jgi:hypothetical protein